MNCSATLGLARTAAARNGSALNGGAILAASSATVATNGTMAKGIASIGNGGGIIGNVGSGNSLLLSSSAMKSLPASSSSTASLVKRAEMAAKIVKQSQIVCFDVDSTVIREEGIDELADFCGKGAEVARVTKEAMGGSMNFQDALTIRLNIIRPNQQQIADFIRQRPSTLTRNVQRFIEQLRADGKRVYLISGGFDCLIEPIAGELGIPVTQLYANKLMFYHNGEYAGFDTTQPTSKSGGKPEAIALIKRQNPHDAIITMIGDGATDLEAVPPANHFIGFGGNVVRAEVQKLAQYYVTDFDQLM